MLLVPWKGVPEKKYVTLNEPYKITIFKGQKWLNIADFIWFNPVQPNFVNSD